MTYLELITTAYRLRNVIDENESPSAEQGVAALETLNQMMAEWLSEGIDLQYVEVPTSLIAEEMTLPGYALSGVIASLAVRIAAGGTISPELMKMEADGYQAICRRAVQAGLPAQKMQHIPAGSGWRRFWPYWR